MSKLKTPYQIGEGYESEITRNCVIWEVKERDHAIHTLLRETIKEGFESFNGYEIANDIKEAEIAQQGAELYKAHILTLIDELFSDKTETNA